jgi:O-methyltransferase domain
MSLGEDGEDWLRSQIEAYHASALAYAVVKLGLPDRMGPRTWTAGALAADLGLSAPHLLRFLRGLVTLGICQEHSDGTFALTTLGQSLKPSSTSRLGEKVTIVVEQYWRPWADLLHTLRNGEPAFEHVFGKSVWDWRREHKEQGRLFESYLAHQTFAQGASILEALECAADARKVADIGGGCGALLAPLLIAFPHLTGVLFEKPHLIEMAKPFLQLFDQFRFRERIDLVAGDFFDAIPIQADLYLLKNVLQQWDDAEALAILRNVRNAMPEGARLAVIERPIPERAADDPSAVMIDLHMMVINGGRARTLQEFEALLAEAGLALSKVHATSSELSVIEAMRA